MPVSVTLRDVLESDLETFYQQQLDPEAALLANFPSRDRESFFIHWRQRILVTPETFKRTVLADGQIAGNVVCWYMQERWHLGYWLGREFWGRGIGTTAVQQALELIPHRPLRAEAFGTNPASLRLLEKCGFQVVANENGWIIHELAALPVDPQSGKPLGGRPASAGFPADHASPSAGLAVKPPA